MEYSPRLASFIDHLDLTVLDLGARGSVDSDLLAIAPLTHMVAFEPEPQAAALLRQRGKGPWRELTILEVAVGPTVGTHTLYVPKSPEGASLYPHNPSLIERFGYESLHRTVQETAVNASTLDHLFGNGVFSSADYIKIDIEGAELDVLKSGAQVLETCWGVKVECSFLEQRMGQPLCWDVLSYLHERGFEVFDVRDLHRWRRRTLAQHPHKARFRIPYSRGQLAQADWVLLRSPDAIGTSEAAQKAATVGAALGYFDYAISVLRAYPDARFSARECFGLDLEDELGAWSRAVGGHHVRSHLRGLLRSLIPLGRSLFGGIPSSRSSLPY